MPEAGSKPSEVIPVLVAVLVCDTAATDPSTGKKSLIGVFDRINVVRFPTSRAMALYLKLTDAEGSYSVEVKWAESKTGQVLAQAKGEAQIESRLQSADLFLTFPPLPIPSEGRYEFQIWANNVYLGGTHIDAIPRK